MPKARALSLTAEVVARVPPYAGPPIDLSSFRPLAAEADHADQFSRLMDSRPAGGDIWLFAYGSLIWKPEFAHDAEAVAVVHGWHRAFCLGWMRAFRGCPERPGLMMALDRGGSCRGMAFLLPQGRAEESLMSVIRRELPFKVSGMTPRWMRGKTADGPQAMIGFPVDRQSDGYLAGASEDTIVQSLATSAGPAGTMAEYLHSTVSHLEERGIRDRYLWRLQALVAARIKAGATP